MIHALLTLAQATPPPDTMVSGNWVIQLIGAVIIAVGSLYGGVKLRDATVQRREVGPQPFEVRERREPSYAEVRALEQRVEKLEEEIEALRTEQMRQYKEMTAAAEERANRILRGVRESAAGIYSKLDTVTKDIRAEMHAADQELAKDLKDVNIRMAREEGRGLRS